MNAAMFRDVLVIVPPVGEQLEIVKKCLTLEYAQDAIIRQILVTNEMKKELLRFFLDPLE